MRSGRFQPIEVTGDRRYCRSGWILEEQGVPGPQGWLSIAIVAATLALILIRPRGVSEAWIALAGALTMVIAGPMRLADIPGVIRETGDVLGFLTGMMVLTALTERAGVFVLLAEGCARLARGSGIALFCLVFLLGAIVTALLSLDVTVIVLTPIVYELTKRRRIDAIPFLFACSYVANTASLIFPISNLTNLLVYHELGLDFASFAKVMWLPNLAALGANLLVFLLIFRSRIPRRFETAIDSPAPHADWWLVSAAIVLAATLAGLFTLGLTGRPLSLAALSGAALLWAIGAFGGRVRGGAVARDVSWLVLVFVVGMLVIVRGLERGWLDHITIEIPKNPTLALIAGTVAATAGSNIVNNVPTALLAVPLIAQASETAREALAYGVLVGCNVGPVLTTYGSLATMLWLTIVRKRGLSVSTREYLAISLTSVPPILIAATAALWLSLR
jgi:arsenical pump membrane protein